MKLTQQELLKEPSEITITGPLYLHAPPQEDNEAANKGYVDTMFNNLNAGELKEGQLSGALVPHFEGAVTNTEGSTLFQLNNTNLVPGTKPKVTVDNKGRVVSIGDLTSNDIPNVPWNKITKDKPNTLTGYGITDLLVNSGGQVGAGFKINGTPIRLH